MQDQSKEMHIIDDELYFIINEQHNSIELTDKGMDYLATLGEDPKFFMLPDVGSQLADLEKENLTSQEKSEKKDQIMQNYAVQSDRVHTINQLMKAYALFENNVEYVVIDNQVKIVDKCKILLLVEFEKTVYFYKNKCRQICGLYGLRFNKKQIKIYKKGGNVYENSNFN
jgi:preprotein translocase subunit SecA